MSRKMTLALMVAPIALALTFGSPALAAGKADRAREAIAKADGKIQAGDAAGVATILPARQAEARHALDTAKEDLSAGRKEDAIADANRASAIAEAALGEAQKRKQADADAVSAENARVQADAAQAQQQAAQAQLQASQADAQRQQAEALRQQAEANAQRQVAEANSRAADAQARAASAEAAASANAAQVETSVTTTESKPAARPARKVVRTKVVRKKAPASTSVTQTTVTQTVRR